MTQNKQPPTNSEWFVLSLESLKLRYVDIVKKNEKPRGGTGSARCTLALCGPKPHVCRHIARIRSDTTGLVWLGFGRLTKSVLADLDSVFIPPTCNRQEALGRSNSLKIGSDRVTRWKV